MNSELQDLTTILADWASGHDNFLIYLFGSRVRGDHRETSDVDVLVRWSSVDDKFKDWWFAQNNDEFQSINSLLPGPLKILEYDEPLAAEIRAAAERPVHTDRNVICVWMPPKPT